MATVKGPDPLRVPPQHLEAEMSVLGSMILDNACISTVRAIIPGPECFFRDSCQTLFRAILTLDDAGSAVDAIILVAELERTGALDEIGGDDFIAEVVNEVPHAANAEMYARIVIEHAVKRGAIQSSSGLIERAFAHKDTAEDLIGIARRNLDSLEKMLPSHDEPESSLKPWPSPPAPEVWHGVAGEIVRMIAPHTEADPMAILAQFLVAFGNVVGRSPHWRVEASRHGVNLNVCVAGNSSKARKGTSFDHIKRIFRLVDDDWSKTCVHKGLSSGEGMIHQVRDPVIRRVKVTTPLCGPETHEEREVDPGVTDKRAFWVESEFGSTLTVMTREGSTLSGVMRQAWDGEILATATKNNPSKATDAHVSIVAHITCEDLARRLSSTDAANGLANRFLWVCARRSQYLPHGGRIWEVNFDDVIAHVREAVAYAVDGDDDDVPIMRDKDANTLWEEVYPVLSEPKAGVLGAVTSRAEAQVMRIACVYALLDLSRYVRVPHLRAALAFWKYCEQSAVYLFGDSLGDPEAEKLLQAIKDAGPMGLTKTQVRRHVFAGRMSAAQYEAKLSVLSRSGLIQLVSDPERPKADVWVSTSLVGFAPTRQSDGFSG